MTWLIYIVMAFMAALVTFVIARACGRGKLSYALMVAIPVLSLAIYLILGRPDLPAYSALKSPDMAERHQMLLAERPLQTLEKSPDDLGALMAMAEISERLGKKTEQKEFLRRAIKSAKKTDDVRLEILKKKLSGL